jgi:nucleoid DNA-binding protein
LRILRFFVRLIEVGSDTGIRGSSPLDFARKTGFSRTFLNVALTSRQSSQNFDDLFFAHLKEEFNPHFECFWGQIGTNPRGTVESDLFRKELNLVRASPEGRNELIEGVQRTLSLTTKKEAAHVVSALFLSLETTLLNHLGTYGLTLKLDRFSKSSVHHRPGSRRKVGFSGETIQTKTLRKVKFISLGPLRQRERVD